MSLQLTTSIERMLSMGMDVREVAKHFNMGERINLKDMVDKLGAAEAFKALPALRESCDNFKRAVSLAIADRMIVFLKQDYQEDCLDLLVATIDVVNGRRNGDHYIQLSDRVMSFNREEPEIGCILAASCIANPEMLNASTLLAAQFGERVTDIKQLVIECLS